MQATVLDASVADEAALADDVPDDAHLLLSSTQAVRAAVTVADERFMDFRVP